MSGGIFPRRESGFPLRNQIHEGPVEKAETMGAFPTEGTQVTVDTGAEHLKRYKGVTRVLVNLRST